MWCLSSDDYLRWLAQINALLPIFVGANSKCMGYSVKSCDLALPFRIKQCAQRESASTDRVVNSDQALVRIPVPAAVIAFTNSTLSCLSAIVMEINSTMRSRRTVRTVRTDRTSRDRAKYQLFSLFYMMTQDLAGCAEQQGNSPSIRLIVDLNCFIISGSYPHLIPLSDLCHVGEQLQ